MTTVARGRPLTTTERALIAYLLTDAVPEAEALRAQARAATASPWCDCGCPSLRLTIDPAHAPRTIAFRGDVDSLAGEAMTKEGSPSHPSWIGLFVHDGWLAVLELADMDGDGHPTTFPPVADLVPPTPP